MALMVKFVFDRIENIVDETRLGGSVVSVSDS